MTQKWNNNEKYDKYTNSLNTFILTIRIDFEQIDENSEMRWKLIRALGFFFVTWTRVVVILLMTSIE